MSSPRSSVPATPRTLGKYEVVRRIAHGGTCDVFEARDPDLGRQVAIKVLRDGTPDRLRVEATAAARLHHPNIVAVHEIGPDYIVMDFIAGRTLAELRPGLAVNERVKILETVARAVDHAHSKGVVHRDLKPANILIEPEGRVVLTDFGIAKLLDGEDLTVTGSVMGTPHYMAPEQVQGRGFGPSVDVWALGVLLYEAVAGRRPFEADSALDVYDQIVRREPVRLPGKLGAIAARALEKDIRRRYPSARGAGRRYGALPAGRADQHPGAVAAPAPAPAAGGGVPGGGGDGRAVVDAVRPIPGGHPGSARSRRDSRAWQSSTSTRRWRSARPRRCCSTPAT